MFHMTDLRMLATAVALAALPGTSLALHGVDVIPEPIEQGNIRIALEPVATGLTAPNWGSFAPGDQNRLFVVDQDGILWAIDLTTATKGVFLDTSSFLVQLGARPGDPFNLHFDERGFIGLAFHPDYQNNGKLYTYTSEPLSGPADFPMQGEISDDAADAAAALGLTIPNHQSVNREWVVPNPANPSSVVDPASSRVLLRIDEPQFNHNSGGLNFGPDAMLYIVVGDGGGADDQPQADLQDFIGIPILGHGEVGNGQNPGTILGSILRIDPEGANSVNGQYGVPADNPFVVEGVNPVGGQAGCADGLCDEIWAYGFRNPFRFSFDTETGLMFIGDVGQNDIEEIDIGVSGGNYGWKIKEGTFLFDHNGADEINGPAFAAQNSPGQPLGMVDPIAQYDHDEGVAVVGGFVYRGTGVGNLRGRYVFGDFSRPPFNPFGVVCEGRLFFLQAQVARKANTQAKVIANRAQSEMREFHIADNAMGGRCLLGFAQDANGEIYVLTNSSGIPFGDSGEVLRIVRP